MSSDTVKMIDFEMQNKGNWEWILELIILGLPLKNAPSFTTENKCYFYCLIFM